MGNNKTKVTPEVVDFILKANIENFPTEVIHQGKTCLVDGFGLILSGSTERSCLFVREQIKAIAGQPEATVLGKEVLKVPTLFAALANGLAGHAMDFDDTQLSISPAAYMAF